MSKLLSTGAINYISQEGGIAQAFNNGILEFYTGSQPASADAAPTGTLLCTFTKQGLSYTPEVRATATITLSGTTSGSINTLTIGGVSIIGAAVNYNNSFTDTAVLLAAAINNTFTIPDYKATASGATVTIIAPKGSGDKLNNLTVAATTTDLTATINGGSNTGLGNTTGSPAGVVAGVTAANGLTFTYPNASAGVAVKQTEAWQGTAGSAAFTSGTQTAGWFRFKGDSTTDNTLSTTAIRFDGSIGVTSAYDMVVSSASITYGAVQTISVFTISTLSNQSLT